ncbi:MAG: nitrogenase [Peptococcaceae bacterium]|jgi:nitrogenase molybdenum-iron protein alpha chain|nr:nitrogenase [Peptococcaceae bacterium]
MDYIEQKIPPIREDRLKACMAYGGSCEEINRDAKKGCLYNNNRKFSQSQGCQLTLSLAILNTIRDSVIIVHSPIGCGANLVAQAGVSKGFQKLRDPNAFGLRWINTNLNEIDVINGGEDKLREAVLYAEAEYRPRAIIIMNSCVPALIGDDIEAVLDDLRPQVSARLVPIHCEGFRTKIQATAYDSVYHGILRNLVGDEYRSEELIEPLFPDEAEELKRQYKISRTVNILNVSSMSRTDEQNLIDLLAPLELNIRVLPCYSHPDDFADSFEAALNVSICATHDDYFAGHMLTGYNVPFILRTIPIGVANTNKWILDIADFFDLREKAEQIIRNEVIELEKAIAPYKEILKGKTVILGGGEIRIITMAELLHSLGMEVLGLRGFHFDQYGENLLAELIEEVPESERVIMNVGTGQPFEQANLLHKYRPDLFVGHPGGNGWANKQGIPVFPLFGQAFQYMGYIGVYEIARRLARFLQNTNYSKNIGRHARLPYRESWYDEEPFAYINQEEEVQA